MKSTCKKVGFQLFLQLERVFHKLGAASAACNVCVYFYSRILNSTIIEVYEFYSKLGLIIVLGNGFVACLMILHLMWTASILRILYNSVILGKVGAFWFLSLYSVIYVTLFI